MGLRGQLRHPDSVRGQREAAAPPTEQPTGECPVAPAWLKAKARKIFEQIVDDAVKAGVITKVMDSHAFAMTAQTICDYQEARDGMERARIGRDMLTWLDVVGGTPKARLRMNIKPKTTAPSKTAQILSLVANK